jgi:hypothetical protein
MTIVRLFPGADAFSGVFVVVGRDGVYVLERVVAFLKTLPRTLRPIAVLKEFVAPVWP